MTAVSSVFFPEEMHCIELVVPHDCSHSVVQSLANADLVHLVDNNVGAHSQEKRYGDDFIHCEEGQRCLRFLQVQLTAYGLLPERPPLDALEAEADRGRQTYREVLPALEEADAALHQRIQSTQQLEQQLAHRKSTLQALRFYLPLLRERAEEPLSDQGSMELELLGTRSFLFSLTGVIAPAKIQPLFVAMYRASRGNILMSRGSDATGHLGYFTIWFQTNILGRKLQQIAVSHGATVFEFPLEEAAIEVRGLEISDEIRDLTRVLTQSYADNRGFLLELQQHFWQWWFFFLREALVYRFMDYADFTQIDDCAIYRAWIPARRQSELQPLLDEAAAASGSARRITFALADTNDPPPTWIETNVFTASFQLLNDSYGYADYDEVNGGAFYSMYPFLFGIMFGDVGHSFLYLLVSLALIVMARKQGNVKGMLGSILEFRYFLLLMALCGIYNGLIYNEWFGLPVNLFGSHWRRANQTISWNRTDPGVYAFGLDPVWMFKDNELIFTNSMKMKIAVVMGVTQMVFGMFLQLIKQVRRKDWIQLWLGWLPQMMYLCSFFVYMVAIVILKWCTRQEPHTEGVNLIQTLINMILSPGKIDPDAKMYNGQTTVQWVVIIVFIASIPLMLIVKPIVEMIFHGVGNGILEVFVVTLIEVIEFTLSALSHTASYLRLWALSLAHSQLSHVLYEELFVLTMNMGNPALVFVGFAGWAAFSVAILLGMECFSSLLHGIRLMWVEFSSKFYSGTGYEFLPLSLKREIAVREEEEE
jgi:V-type H+-transporting ATPase subunit a